MPARSGVGLGPVIRQKDAALDAAWASEEVQAVDFAVHLGAAVAVGWRRVKWSFRSDTLHLERSAE